MSKNFVPKTYARIYAKDFDESISVYTSKACFQITQWQSNAIEIIMTHMCRMFHLFNCHSHHIKTQIFKISY